MYWTEIAVTTGLLRVSSLAVWFALCLLKRIVWMCLHRDEWSHRDSPTEATSTHTDEVSPRCEIAFTHTISIKFKEQLVGRICLLYICLLARSLIPHTSKRAPTYLLIYHLHAHIHLLRRLPTGLVIAARLFCIHMRVSQHSLFLSLFLSYEYKIVKAESKETWEVSSIPLFSISSPRSDSSDTWLNYFILLRGDQV